MRDILFRGKRTDNGEWVYGGFVKQNDFYGQHIDQCRIIDGESTEDNYIGYSYEVDKETVGQFVGMADKTGALIFEGDIIQQGKRKGRIYYYDSFGMFMISWLPHGGANIFMNVLHSEVEVIGNIHDNPDLMKEG